MKKLIFAVVCFYALAAYGLTKMRSVAIVASTIDSTPIGSTSPSTGVFTTLTAASLNGPLNGNATSANTATTATQLAATPTNCGSTTPAYGISANGNALCTTSSSTYKLQFGTTTSTCTTGSSSYDSCPTTVFWPSNFADTNYVAVCFGGNPNNPRAALPSWSSKAIGSIIANTVTEGSVGVRYSEIDCIGLHQ